MSTNVHQFPIRNLYLFEIGIYLYLLSFILTSLINLSTLFLKLLLPYRICGSKLPEKLFGIWASSCKSTSSFLSSVRPSYFSESISII